MGAKTAFWAVVEKNAVCNAVCNVVCNFASFLIIVENPSVGVLVEFPVVCNAVCNAVCNIPPRAYRGSGKRGIPHRKQRKIEGRNAGDFGRKCRCGEHGYGWGTDGIFVANTDGFL